MTLWKQYPCVTYLSSAALERVVGSNCHAMTELSLLGDPLRAMCAVDRRAVPGLLTIGFTLAFASGGCFDRICRALVDRIAAPLFRRDATARPSFFALKVRSNSPAESGGKFPFVHGRLGDACVRWHAATCAASPRAYRLTASEFVPQLNPSATDPGLVHGERITWLLCANHMNHYADSRIDPLDETMSLQAQ